MTAPEGPTARAGASWRSAPEPEEGPLGARWSLALPAIFSIDVDSPKAAPGDARGYATEAAVHRFSDRGRVEHFCTTPGDYPLRVRFYLDTADVPRPQPFRPPALSVAAEFTPSGGSMWRIADAADSAPRYLGAGRPLAPAFGEVLKASASESGMLRLRATLDDAETATTVTYRDAVACKLVPCA